MIGITRGAMTRMPDVFTNTSALYLAFHDIVKTRIQIYSALARHSLLPEGRLIVAIERSSALRVLTGIEPSKAEENLLVMSFGKSNLLL